MLAELRAGGAIGCCTGGGRVLLGGRVGGSGILGGGGISGSRFGYSFAGRGYGRGRSWLCGFLGRRRSLVGYGFGGLVVIPVDLVFGWF